MKVAVVGAGVSGLTTAYLLGREHEVDLFERNNYAGGHTNTIPVEVPEGALELDMGFIIYNEPTYPLFSKLLEHMGVASQPTDMSLSVSCDCCRLQYSTRGLRGYLAQPANLLRKRLWVLARDVVRFQRTATAHVDDSRFASTTVGEYTARYSDEFKRHFLLPLAAAVWSTDPGEAAHFPLPYFLRFLARHKILGFGPTLGWRVVARGSRTYVRRLLEGFSGRLHLRSPVQAIRRTDEGIALYVGGQEHTYDCLVLACHADEALGLLADADQIERRALSTFGYNQSQVVLHTDSSMLPARHTARASWNYATDGCHNGGALQMTYHLNRLQSLPGPVDYCVSVNPGDRVDPSTIISDSIFQHPRYTFAALEGQSALKKLNGRRNTYFAGAHLGYGFHEDGVASAVAVAGQFGIAL